jgi:hypothetical protein
MEARFATARPTIAKMDSAERSLHRPPTGVIGMQLGRAVGADEGRGRVVGH